MKETLPSKENNCNFSGIRPAMADLSWPPLRVCGKNPAYMAKIVVQLLR